MTELLERFERQFLGSSQAVIDLETTGLDWRKNKIISYAVAFSNRDEDVYYFPIRHNTGNAPKAQKIEEFILSQLKRQDLTIIGHNLMFDLLFMKAAGSEINCQLRDTMINAALLDEYAKSYNLKTCAAAAGVTSKADDQLFQYMAQYFGDKPIEEVTRAVKNKYMGRLQELPGDAPEVETYVKGDVISTYELYQAQLVPLEEQALLQVVELESRLMHPLLDVQFKGVKINEGRLDEVTELVEKDLLRARGYLPSDFNPSQPSSVRKLFDGYDKSLIPRTPKGGLSFNSAFLDTTDVGKTVNALRKLTKLKNTFLTPLRNEHLWEGYIHAHYHQTRSNFFERGDPQGTATGRLSCTDPNLQQVPKRDEGNSTLLRSLFIPDDGFLWSSNDLSQAEYRLFAHYTGDEQLIQGYLSDPPIDMHSNVAHQLGLDPSKKEDRHKAKTLNFSILYGAGIAKIAAQLKITEEAAKVMRQNYYRAIPSVKTFMDQTKYWAERRGYVKTILGRRCRFNEVENKYYKAANRIIQGSNSDYTKLKICEIYDYFKSEGDAARILLTIHDSIDWQFQKGAHGEKVNKEAIRIFSNENESVIKLKLPMPVDSAVGNNWAEATFGEAE